jgi:hypothetical protein
MDSKPGIAVASLARIASVALIASAALVMGCAGPPIPAPIEGEPVCADIEIGAAHSKMIGGLTYPVRLRILDGKNVMMKMIISGKRTPADPPSHTLLPDDNAEYVLEWAQCANERAPRPISSASKTRGAAEKDMTAFDCGEATIYKTDKLVTKKHDAASHVFAVPPPPKTDCWVGQTPPVTPPPVVPPPPSVPAPVETTAPSASAVPSSSAALPLPSAAPVAKAAPIPSAAPIPNAAPVPIIPPAPKK